MDLTRTCTAEAWERAPGEADTPGAGPATPGVPTRGVGWGVVEAGRRRNPSFVLCRRRGHGLQTISGLMQLHC